MPRKNVTDQESKYNTVKDIFFWSITPILRAKLLCVLPKTFMPPQVRYSCVGPTTMPTHPIKTALPIKLAVSIIPTLLDLPAMPTGLACYAYITNKKQPLNYSFVA